MTTDGEVPDPRTLLGRYGLAAKKSFGQNFLISSRAYRAIVDAAVLAEDDWVVEVGAGLGTLTARLALRTAKGRVVAVERDPDMVAVLQSELGKFPNVQVEPGDALRFDYAACAEQAGRPLSVCGNLPYHIASQILFQLLDARRHIRQAVVMIQREMAERILASPGTKEYGAMGVLLTTFFDARLITRLGPGAFVPPPKVDSSVILLTPLPGAASRAPIPAQEHYFNVVHAAFGQRRKTLRNALRARFPGAVVDEALHVLAIDGQRRGETCSIPELAAIANQLPT